MIVPYQVHIQIMGFPKDRTPIILGFLNQEIGVHKSFAKVNMFQPVDDMTCIKGNDVELLFDVKKVDYASKLYQCIEDLAGCSCKIDIELIELVPSRPPLSEEEKSALKPVDK